MGLADRDYMRRDPPRWEARHDGGTAPSQRSDGRRVIAIAAGLVALAGVLVAGGWLWRDSRPLEVPIAEPSAAPRDERAPGAETPAAEAGPGNPVLVGTVSRVVDGDTIKVELSSGPVEVRLDSIDTPERNQPWGTEATTALARRVDGREVALDVVTQDRYERLVAVVYLGDENVNAWLVQQGHAWAYRQYLKDAQYCTWEAQARVARQGFWSQPAGQWQAPWEWRQVERRQAGSFTDYSPETIANCTAAIGKRPEPAAQSVSNAPGKSAATSGNGDCRIKGNISGSGKIYHVPGRHSYSKTVIDESKGERWFCTEEEARAAGWRAPKG
jgi:endonuclease YncB( thermonuclease family)